VALIAVLENRMPLQIIAPPEIKTPAATDRQEDRHSSLRRFQRHRSAVALRA